MLVLYQTLHTVLQLHKSLTQCPRSGISFYHTSDFTTLEKVQSAEWVLRGFHIWRRMLRLDKNIEKRKSPLSGYKVVPTYLFRRLKVSPMTRELGLKEDERMKMPYDKEKVYHDFKCDFVESWTQCKVHGDEELVALLDLMIEKRAEEWRSKHGCFQKWVFPKKFVRERLRDEFAIWFGGIGMQEVAHGPQAVVQPATRRHGHSHSHANCH